jgi:hypothetical protein
MHLMLMDPTSMAQSMKKIKNAVQSTMLMALFNKVISLMACFKVLALRKH